MLTRLAIAAALALASCATAPGPDRVTGTREIDLAVPVSCIPAATPQAPGHVPTADELKAMSDAAARHQALARFYLEYAPWIAMAVPLIENCRNAAPAPTAPLE